MKLSKNISSPSFRTHTFGCKVNFCDTNGLAEGLVTAGFFRASAEGSATVEILNTCAVTSKSVQKVRGLIRHVRAANPDAHLVVMGCAVTMGEEALLAMKEVDFFCKSQDEAFRHLGEAFALPAQQAGPGFDPERTRAFLKIQEGCDSFCTYCVVPYVRGRPRSVPAEEALIGVRNARDAGYREIVLSGTHIGRYGRDLGGVTLGSLMGEIGKLDGDFRVRLSSIEPLEVTDELLGAMSSSARFCKHLHMPLQSGSDRILAAMNRPYTSEQFLEVTNRARDVLENPAITTDIMVGFPGETQDDHEATLRVAAQTCFARAHVFVYSQRPGTAAAGMLGRVASPDAKRRSSEVRELCEKTGLEFRRGLVGQRAQVLAEEMRDGVLEGFCGRYQRVRFPGYKEQLGSLVSVILMEAPAEGTELKGQADV